MNLVLANAEDIRILKKVFFSGHILRENDIYKVVEIVPSGLILAKCQDVSKKKNRIATELQLPLKTMFLLHEDEKEDEFFFASQIIRDHYDHPIEYRHIIRNILYKKNNQEDSNLNMLLLGKYGGRDRPMTVAKVSANFFLSNLQIEQQQFRTSGVFSDHAMEQLERGEITIDMFGIPSIFKVETIQQLVSLYSKKTDKTKKMYRQYLIQIWDNYMQTSCDLVEGIKEEKVGDALVAWLKKEKILDSKIKRFEQLKAFVEFTRSKTPNREKKRKSGEAVTPSIQQLQELNRKRRKTIARLKYQVEQLRSGKKLKSCPKCKKAGGICTSRGKEGHLPLISIDSDEDDGGDIERPKTTKNQSEILSIKASV
tara:strand:+ start:3084 stop:4190 length:1107 start_codon:yes stop_codon:yes gene_type:complete